MKATHGFAPGAPADRLTCLCGHVELIDGSFSKAVERMNAHVRGAYTDQEWEELMSETKLALLDGTTGALKMPDEGPKS